MYQVLRSRFLKLKKLRQPVVYKRENLQHEDIEGVFYEPELQKVVYDETKLFKVEKIIGKRRRKGRTEYLVKFLGYPEKFNQWISSEEFERI